jgi:protease-4
VLRDLEIGADGVATTPLSGEPDILGGLSPDVERLFQAGTDDIYNRFLTLVSESRNMPRERIEELAQGRVWAGATARQLGLVDRFGSLDDAILLAAEEAGVEADDVNVIWIEQPADPFTEFVRNWSREEDAEAAAPRDVWTLLRPDPRAILAIMLGEMRMMLDGPAMQARCLECPVDVVPGSGRGNGDATTQAMLLGWLRG